MMLDYVGVERVSRQIRLRVQKIELLSRHEPQQVSLATAMRTIAFNRLLQYTLNLEGYLPAVTATSVVHVRAPEWAAHRQQPSSK